MRLVVVPGDQRPQADHVRFNLLADMVGVEPLGSLAGEGALIEARIGETDGEGLHRSRELARHDADHAR